MTITSKLLSEIELLPKEYEQEVFDFISFLRSKVSFESGVPGKTEITIEDAFGILRGMNIDSNIERDEKDRI